MADILLGGKRVPRTRHLGRKIGVTLALLVLAVVIAYIALLRATAYSIPRGEVPAGPLGADGARLVFAGSSLERAGELWVLRLQGEAFASGAAQARLLGAATLTDGVLDPLLLGEAPPGGLFGLRHDLSVRWRLRLLADGIPVARRAELAGLVAGLVADQLGQAPPSYQRLVWRQAALDVGSMGLEGAPVGGVTSALAFAVGGRGGPAGGTPTPFAHLFVGRAFGLGAIGAPGEVVVSFVRAPGAIPFARVGWPGQVGVVTGINGEGVAVALNPTASQDVRAQAAAEPLGLLARDVLERAHSLDEAIAVVQAARPLGAGSFLVCDGKAGTWAVIERTPARTVVLRPKTPPATGDFLTAPELAKDADNDRARRVRGGGARLDRLLELLGRPVAAEPAAIAGVLRDRRGKGDARLALGNGNAVDDLDQAHVAILDVTGLFLWVGEGPGAAGSFRAFDLRHELNDEPPRAGAQTLLPADPSLDLAAARAVVGARRELRSGERSLRQHRSAADASARALALAPELAEAHKLAGDVAREAGDAAHAAEHYRRFLELGPTDRAAEEEVRAFLGSP